MRGNQQLLKQNKSMTESQKKEFVQKLERISTHLQNQLSNSEQMLNQAILLGSQLGYTFCRKTGKLKKM